jgi:predicted nucleic acid-binding protein
MEVKNRYVFDTGVLVSAALCGNASFLVTGDQDVLVLHPFRGIPILTPAQFLAALTVS